MDKEFLRALYNFFKCQQLASKSVNDVLAHLPEVKSFSGSLDISSDPLWPSWRKPEKLSDEEIERLNRNYENHCASGL